MIKYSVIIPTYNATKRISNALCALLRQTVKPEEMEIIVINDGSTDQTEKIVLKFKQENPGRNIVYILKENGGPASARNVGLKHARGKIIFFTDDDCLPPALWMEKILQIYKKNPGIAGVGGWYNPPLHVLRSNSYEQFLYLFDRATFSLDMDFGSGVKTTRPWWPFPATNTGNLSLYKWIFEKAGAFNETFRHPGLEDMEFCEKIHDLGFKIYYAQLHIIHDKNTDLFQFIRLCASKSRSIKNYCRIKNIDPDTYLPKSRKRYKNFKMACDHFEQRFHHFQYKKTILLTAILYFFLQNFLVKWPFFERPNRT